MGFIQKRVNALMSLLYCKKPKQPTDKKYTFEGVATATPFLLPEYRNQYICVLIFTR